MLEAHAPQVISYVATKGFDDLPHIAGAQRPVSWIPSSKDDSSALPIRKARLTRTQKIRGLLLDENVFMVD